MTRTVSLRDQCPNRAQHTSAPERYVAWHGWAEDMSDTHNREQCPGCGLWVIWTPKPARQEEP